MTENSGSARNVREWTNRFARVESIWQIDPVLFLPSPLKYISLSFIFCKYLSIHTKIHVSLIWTKLILAAA